MFHKSFSPDGPFTLNADTPRDADGVLPKALREVGLPPRLIHGTASSPWHGTAWESW